MWPHGSATLQALRPSPVRERLLRRFVSLRSLAEGRALPKGLRLLVRTFVPERAWLTLLYGLEDAPGWRVRLQQVWDGGMCSSGWGMPLSFLCHSPPVDKEG